MEEKQQHYFKNTIEWRNWLNENHNLSAGIYLIFYKINNGFETMRWEEAVQVAICFGWIDSTVKKIDVNSRKQIFGPRKDKSVWSKLNKTYIEKLTHDGLMHESGFKKIEIAISNGSWEALDNVENLILPEDLAVAFQKNKKAFNNYTNFSVSYRKNYLYWLNQAKREETRSIRIATIILLCAKNQKSRD